MRKGDRTEGAEDFLQHQTSALRSVCRVTLWWAWWLGSQSPVSEKAQAFPM